MRSRTGKLRSHDKPDNGGDNNEGLESSATITISIIPIITPGFWTIEYSSKYQSSKSPKLPRHTMKTTNPSKFLELPDELLHQIIRSISPEEVFLNVQLACKRLRAACSQPLLWKDHCQAEFKYWDPKHRIQQKLKGRVNDVDWRKLYVHRMRTDEEITRILDDILRAQVGRIGRFARIEQFGYDAKDTLLRHCRTGEEAEDVLARR